MARVLPLLPLLAAGCSTIYVRPPPPPEESATVYIVDRGDTARLLLPRPDDADAPFVEYAYGDWNWYAKDRGNALYATFVFLVPTRGTLARREYPVDPTGSRWAQRVIPIDVERRRANTLVTFLDDRFESKIDTRHVNDARGLEFVHDDNAYWVFNQSSTAIACWLRELGCTTSGFTVKADFKLDERGTMAPRDQAVARASRP